jgi:HD superfamily phosphohydrolase
VSQINKLKIFNDPIYGFITIPNALIYDLIQHPYFQRLRRISQMGLSYLVYPGANHTRFHHALGCMHLKKQLLYCVLKVAISVEGKCALYCYFIARYWAWASHAMEKYC